MTNDLRVAIDLDGVVAGFVPAIVAHQDTLPVRLPHRLTVEDCQSWDDAITMTGLAPGDFWAWAREVSLFRTCPVEVGAREVLLHLRHSVGLTMDVVTHRPQWAEEATIRWLEETMLGRCFADVVVTQQPKSSTGHWLYLDDSPHVLTEVRRAGRVAVRYGRPWNQGIPADAAVWTWGQVPGVLKALAEEWGGRRKESSREG